MVFDMIANLMVELLGVRLIHSLNSQIGTLDFADEVRVLKLTY